MKNERLEQCKVYTVSYTVLGRGGKKLSRIEECVVAMDVADLVDEIRKLVMGVELTSIDDAGKLIHHEVAEAVEVESATLIGRLHGITGRAHAVVTRCDDQERS